MARTISRQETNEGFEPSLIKVLHALADPVRLEIVRQLDEAGEKACGTFGINMPKSSMSHHFSTLRKSSVIASRVKGALLMNRLRRTELEASFPGVLDSILTGVRRYHHGPLRQHEKP